MAFILGKKVKMTQLWQEDAIVPVTIVEAVPNTVSFVRTADRDGYKAVQLAMGKTKKEFRLDEKAETPELNTALDVSSFTEGGLVRISGTVKGRGFAGVMKRHNFAGGPATHGQKNRQRAPGSIGSTAPQRVVPGRRMAGHMGTNRHTVKNMTVIKIDKDQNLIFLKGAVPGARGSLVEIRSI